ncbi:MAG: DUF4868 domain-containing protein [Paeniclostridium sordellii]|nr:DUF4868 domain-containing protein [Paeniclostridium sordellii]
MTDRENKRLKENILNEIGELRLEEELEINVMFVDKRSKRKKKYIGYATIINKTDILETISSSFQYLEDEIGKRSFEKYDLELSLDETVQIVEKDQVINTSNVIDELIYSIDEGRILEENFDMTKINFIVIQIYSYSKDKSMYFFQKYVHPTSKYKRAYKYTLHGREARPIKKDIITLNPMVDAVLLDSKFYILDRKSFNTIFDFKDVFYKVIDENKQEIEDSGLFVSADVFLKECSENGKHLPRLTKVILSKGFKTVKENKHKLKELKDRYNLSFELTHDNRIKYNDKEDIPDILKVLLNYFVKSALTDKDMIARAIEKYEV